MTIVTPVPVEHGAEPTIASRRFVLQRSRDISGVSGIGIVADGVEFPDGVVVMRWRGGTPSTVVQDHGISAVEAIHGHDGHTRIVWLDE